MDTIEGVTYAQTFTIANANATVKGLMTGNVKLNIANGITYGLGSKHNSLVSVQVSENSTVKGDVYSNKINITVCKNIFLNEIIIGMLRRISLYKIVLVDIDLLPRSLQLFTYLTNINADKLHCTGCCFCTYLNI